jgi:putative ABC transport system ATP-binding protein
LFSAQARRNTTLVLVTHDEKLAQRCSRVVRMSDGNIVPATPEPVAA